MENDREDIAVLLNRVRFVLEEGQPQRAREILERIFPENEEQQKEITYLQAWSYIQDKSWDEAENVLAPLVSLIEETEAVDEESSHERQRRALCLLYLGDVAANLGHYEDASRHYTRCLKLLQGRGIQLPKAQVIRVKVRYSLGTTLLMRGLYPAAKQHYEVALALYEEAVKSSSRDWREDLAAIYYGFCNLYRKTGNLFDALEMGVKALDVYEELQNCSMKGRMHNQLGHIYIQLNEFRNASDHFTTALATATACDSPKMIMVNCTALAKLRLTEGRLKEAIEYCTLAMSFTNRFKDDLLSGMAYLITGTVVQAEADHLQGEQRYERMRDALRYFEQAYAYLGKTQAYEQIGEVQGRRAEVLEMLGRTQEAIACWNSAYKAQADSYGPTWY